MRTEKHSIYSLSLSRHSRRPNPGSFRYKLGKFAHRHRQRIVSIFSSGFLITKAAIVRADSILKPAQDAMKCIVRDATSNGGVTNAIFAQLPFILFTGLELIIFAYLIYTIVQAVSAYGQGQEVTHLVQQPVVTFLAICLIFVFQSVIFGSGDC